MTTAWDAELYAANTAHHRRHDSDFLGGIRLPAGSRLLDVGCGVGDFTARLAALVGAGDGGAGDGGAGDGGAGDGGAGDGGAGDGGGIAAAGSVLGVDADPGMVAAAEARYGSQRVRFAVARAQQLDAVVPAASMDAVFSVAALHWVSAQEHPAMLAQVRRALRPGGLFRAEFGGHGQIAAVKAILDAESARLGGGPAGWFFPSPEDYRPLLAAAGFAVPQDGWVRLRRQVRAFPTAGELLGWLRSQTFPAYEPVLPDGVSAQFRARSEEQAVAGLRRADGSFDLDFVRLDLLVRAV